MLLLWLLANKHWKKDIKDEAKAVLQKERLLVADFKVLLHWKLGDEFSLRTKGLKGGWVESIVGSDGG
jgi:hypothetical protein